MWTLVYVGLKERVTFFFLQFHALSGAIEGDEYSFNYETS